MNRFKVAFFTLLGASIILSAIMLNQITVLQTEKKTLTETNENLRSTLDQYKVFVNTTEPVSPDIINQPWSLKAKVYLSPYLDELSPVESIKVGQLYSVTAEVTRLKGNFNSPTGLHYVLIIQVNDSEGKRIATSWSIADVLPICRTSYGGLYWKPDSEGKYTVEAFVWNSLQGTPLAEKAEITVNVTK